MKLNQIVNKKWLAVVAVSALTVTMAVAQGPGRRGPGGPGGHGPGGEMLGLIGTAIGLTDAQRAEIRSIVEQSMEANQTLHEQTKALREEARKAVQAGASDAELAAIVAKAAPVQTQLRTAQLQTAARIHRVLTPEQRAKLEEMRAKMKERFGNRFGSNHRRRGPAPAAEAQ